MTRSAPPSLALITLILVLASSISIMSTDMYTPSLPHLPEYFGTSESTVQLTISLNLLAFAAGQLFLGPLSDRFGRRPTMLAGLLVFTACSLACAAAQSAGQLIAARVLQGLSASVEAVVGLAIVSDLFDEVRRVRALAIWGAAVALAPAIAPIIGGYVHVAFGWRANFLLLTVAGIAVCALVWRLLPESTEPDGGALHPGALLARYARLLANRGFIGNALILGCSLGAIFAFITAGPFILIEGYGVATEHYGFYHAAIVAAFFAGSLFANRLAGRVASERILRSGLAASAAGAAALVAAFASGALGPTSLAGSMCLFAFGLGPVFAVAPMFALDAAGGGAGTASALLGAVEMGIGGAASVMVTALHDGTEKPLVVTVLVLLAVAAAGLAATGRRRATG